MFADPELEEQLYIERLKGCICQLEAELDGLLAKAKAEGWEQGEIANALAFIAVMKQWEVKEAQGAARVASMMPADFMH